MSAENVTRFVKKMLENPSKAVQLDSCRTLDDFLEFARGEGHEFGADEAREALAPHMTARPELSDDELGGVHGGTRPGSAGGPGPDDDTPLFTRRG